MNLKYTHFAMSVPRATFTDEFVTEALGFYGEYFGWREASSLRVHGERLTVYTATNQYVNIRASDSPMIPSGYEHLGFAVESHQHLINLHDRLARAASEDRRASLTPINFTEVGDEQVYSFRFAFLLPVALEIQYFPSEKRT